MKKTLLALAVSAFGANAFAADVDFTVTNPIVNTIATELALPANNAVTTTDTLTWDLGFSVTTATQRYIKVSLTNGAKFTNDPSLVVGSGPAESTGALSQGGAGQSFVIMEVTPAGNLTPIDDVVVTLAGLTLTGKNEVGVSYQLFETAVDAVNGTNALVNVAAKPYIKFGTGLVATFQPFNVQRVIDVAANPTSSAFTGALDANSVKIGAVAIDAVPGLVNYSMAPVALTNLVGTGTALEVEGDFSAGLKTAGALNVAAVKLGGDADDANGVSASSLTATKATFVVDAAVQGDPATPSYVDVVYHVGTGAAATAIAPSSYFANYKVVPATNTTTASVSLGKIGELAKNGASQYVDLALKPGGAYQNFVRISNKTNVAGNVYVTVIADDGQQETVNLGDIAGQTNTLAARSSTTQISIQQIFDAAAAKGLTLSGEGKLRLLVDGEFPVNGNTDNANDYGLSVQTYTVSKDGNSFSTF